MSHGKKSTYFYELNFIRGIACLMVVMVHVTARNYYLNEREFDWFVQFLNQITRFGTPLFAIIGGFLLFNQSFNHKFKLKKFAISKTTKIMLPFVIWSLFYLYIGGYSFPWEGEKETYKEFIIMFILGDAQYQLYFIIVVIQFYLLFSILQFIKNKHIMYFFTLLSFFLTYYFMQKPFDFGLPILNHILQDRSSIFYWIFYFFVGGLFAMHWGNITSWVRRNFNTIAFFTLLIIIFSVFEYIIFGRYDSTRPANLFYVPIIFMFLTGVYFSLGKLNFIKKHLVELGNLSMGIYLIHPFVITYVSTIFPVIYKETIYIPTSFVITLLVSVMITKVIGKLPFGSILVTVAISNKKHQNK